MAVLVRANGQKEPWRDLSLEGMQTAVEGYIEYVPCQAKIKMVVNEEGRVKGLPINLMASAIAGRELYGNVLFVTEEELEQGGGE